MKTAQQITGKNFNDLMKLPCVRAVVKDRDAPAGFFVYLDPSITSWECMEKRKTSKAFVGEWLVEGEDMIWEVKKLR